MKIRIIESGLDGDHTVLFPNVCFATGDIDITPEWLNNNGCEAIVPEPIILDPEPVYIPTEQDIINGLTLAVQMHLDSKARERNYDGILSACTYVTSTVPKFSAEGQACVEWRDACWARCYEVMADVQQALRPIPTPEELINELPAFAWPA